MNELQIQMIESLQDENPRRPGRGLEKANTPMRKGEFAMNQYSTHRYESQNDKLNSIYKKQDDMLFKTAIARKHMMRSPKGWAIDKSVLSNAIHSGLNYVVIYEKEHSLYYRSKLQDFLTHGLEIKYGNFGNQIVLPIKYWQITVPGQPVPCQLALPL